MAGGLLTAWNGNGVPVIADKLTIEFLPLENITTKKTTILHVRGIRALSVCIILFLKTW